MTNITIWTPAMGAVLTTTTAAVYFYCRYEMGRIDDE